MTIKLSSPTGTDLGRLQGPAGKTAHLIFDVSGYYVPMTSTARSSRSRPAGGWTPGSPPRRRASRAVRGERRADARRRALPGRAGQRDGHHRQPDRRQPDPGRLRVDDADGDDQRPEDATHQLPDRRHPRANGVTGPLSGPGNVAFVYEASNGQTHLVLDLTGYFR